MNKSERIFTWSLLIANISFFIAGLFVDEFRIINIMSITVLLILLVKN